MNGTGGLIGFLRARLDEDERDAQGAGGKPWSWEQQYGDMCNDSTCPYGQLATDDTVLMEVHGLDTHSAWQGAAHIARQDPAHTLAEVAAKRALIDDLLSERHEVVDGDCWYTCAAATQERDDGETCDDSRAGGPCDCGRDSRLDRRLRLLALPYADHPDFKKEEWRP